MSECVKEFNSRTHLCRSAEGELYVAKRESIDDSRVIENRIELIDRLSDESFPCPRIIEIDGRRYEQNNGHVTVFQQYIDFSGVDQRDSYDPQRLVDSTNLLIEFQRITRSLANPELENRFGPMFEKVCDRRDQELARRPNRHASDVLEWMRAELVGLDALPKVPCHASFRHHNLFYDKSGVLHLIDFFHGLSYAPRIYDLCVMMSGFHYGLPFGRGSHAMQTVIRNGPFRSLWHAAKWGRYNCRDVELILQRIAIEEPERHLVIPCYVFVAARNMAVDFTSLVTSVRLRSFINILARCLGTDAHPFS